MGEVHVAYVKVWQPGFVYRMVSVPEHEYTGVQMGPLASEKSSQPTTVLPHAYPERAPLLWSCVTPYPEPLKLIQPSHPPPFASARSHPENALPFILALQGFCGHPDSSDSFAVIHPMLSLHAYPESFPLLSALIP